MGERRCSMKTHCGYNSGHPWYYLLGGKALAPKQIRDCAKASSYRGYREEKILAAGNKAEPKRSEALRKIRREVMNDLTKDISVYRHCVFELNDHRRNHGEATNPVSCDDVHTAMSLKHNHIYNGFAHLACLDELPEQQCDLFEL